MPISIPIDAHLVTLLTRTSRVEETTVRQGTRTAIRRQRVQETARTPPGRDETNVRKILDLSNAIWTAADIQFVLRSIAPAEEELPGVRDHPEVVDRTGFEYLASRYRGQAGASLVLVRRFEGPDLGGQAAEELGSCVLPQLDDTLSGKVLAHELGHLLGLPHVEDHYNVMYKALSAAQNLTAEQSRHARASALARQSARAAADH